MEKKKILEITGEPILHGGQEVFIFNFIENANLENISIDVLTPYTCENENYKEKIKKTGKIIEFGLPFLPGKSRGLIFKPVYNYLKNNHYDIVHIHSGSISVLAYLSLAAKLCKVKKIIVHSHCTGIDSIKHTIVKVVYSPLMRFCPTDYCTCSYEAGLWKFSKSISDNELKIITNGIELENFEFNEQYREEIRNRFGIKDEFVVGHIGRFSDQKNHKFLIHAFKEFNKDCPNSKLMLVGDGELIEEIRQQVTELNLTEAVIFVGNVDDAYRYYNAMDIFCLPSLHEGFPIVNIEAQVSGLDVLIAKDLAKEACNMPYSIPLAIDDTKIWVDELYKKEQDFVSKIKDTRKALISSEREERISQVEQYSIVNTIKELMNLYQS